MNFGLLSETSFRTAWATVGHNSSGLVDFRQKLSFTKGSPGGAVTPTLRHRATTQTRPPDQNVLTAELQLPSEASAVGLGADLQSAADELGAEVHLSPIADDVG